MRKILNVLLLASLVAVAFYWFYKDFESPDQGGLDTLTAVPQTAALIFESDDLADVWRDLSSKSLVWNELRSTDYFFQLTELGNSLDSLIRSDSGLRGLLADKPLAVSAHMTGSRDFDFLFAMQTDPEASLNEIHNALDATFRTKESDTKVYDGENITSFLSPFFDGRLFYFVHGNLLVFSFAEVLAEESARTLSKNASVLTTPQFNAVRETTDDGARAHVYVNYDQLKTIISRYASPGSKGVGFFNQPYADWSALDLFIDNDAIELNGFVMAADSSRAWLDAFSANKAPEIDLLGYLPSNTAYFAFFGYGNFASYQDQKRRKQEKNGDLFQVRATIDKFDAECNCDSKNLGTSWIGTQALAFISEPVSKAYEQNVFAVFEAQDAENAEEMLRELASSIGTEEDVSPASGEVFRLRVGDFYRTAVGDAFDGLNDPFAVRMGDAIVMANSENAIRNYLSAIEAGRSFDTTEEYSELKKHLFRDAHFVLYNSLARSPHLFGNILDEKYDSEIEGHTELLRNFRSFVYQISHSSGDLFYNNIHLQQGSDYEQETGALWEVQLRTKAMGRTHLVKNHYTGAYEILVQDANNRAYLVSNNGKIVWETTLDGPIMGEVKQVDVYKNKKLQMLFNTENKVYLLDRNGNPVESFPVGLPALASAEVSFADYDNIRDYRIFIPIATGEILCFDAYGKSVDGWSYDAGEESAVLPVKHIRIKRKDYLFSLTESGMVLLLNRKGKPRHKVAQRAVGFMGQGHYVAIGSKISNSALYFADSTGTAFRLGFDDGLEKLRPKTDLPSDCFFSKFDGNESIDFGFLYEGNLSVYSFEGDILAEAQLPTASHQEMDSYNVAGRSLACVLNSEQDELYLFNTEGELISGFPVYGSSLPGIRDINLDGYPNLVTTGRDGFVYAYSVELD